jgi:tRNA A37 threonylcarbamoyladenosine synthetase subunit TsaC/SUA5/YrdC
MGRQLDLVIDGGILSADVSSVVSLLHDTPVVLRKGVGETSWCGEQG